MYDKEILEVYRFCDIHTFPIDCRGVFLKFGYRVITYQEAAKGDPAELRKLKQISNDGFIVRKEECVYINSEPYERRQLFTLAHELGHLVLVTNSEDEANTFASHFLAPRSLIFARKLRTADEISSAFGISVQAANNAILSPFYVPDPYALKIIEHFREEFRCPDLFFDKPAKRNISYSSPFLKSAARKAVHTEKVVDIRKIRSLESQYRRLNTQIRNIDALAPDAEKQYEALRRRLWDVESRLEYLRT